MKGFLLVILMIPVLSLIAEQPDQDLPGFRKRGDFLNESLLRSKLEETLSELNDPAELTRMKRSLYIEAIPLPEDIFFDTGISALSADQDDIWAGSRSGDIARYSLSERSWVSFVRGRESLAIRTVQSIQGDPENIWILSYGSVAVYSKRHDSFIPLNIPDTGEYRGLQSGILMGNGLICGTQGTGLRRIRLDGYSSIPQHPELRNITFLKSLGSDSLLAGTEEDGLFVLDSRYQPRPLLENNRRTSAVRVVFDAGEDRMIGGSYGSGLFMLAKKNEKYDIVFLGAGVRWITGGVEIPGFYCFTTLGNGLVVIDRKSLETKVYGISEGLGGLDFSSITYVAPYVVCALQGQGLVRIHENYFKEP